MKKSVLLSSAILVSSATVVAAPVIKASSVTMSQNPSTRTVSIDYELEEDPAIVTIDIQTNGVSIGESNLRYFMGDVNKKVEIGKRSASWQASKAWPGHKLSGGVTAVVTAWATNTPPDYMVIDLCDATVRYYVGERALPLDIDSDVYRTDQLVMRKIPAGHVEWRIGSPANEGYRSDAGETARHIALSNDYYIGVFEVTQRQYERVKGTRPSYFNNADYYMTRPVEQVSYEALRGASASGYNWPADGHKVLAGTFFEKLRTLVGGGDFDLPTDAQWEFACRAGCGAALYNGKELTGQEKSSYLGALARYDVTGSAPQDSDTTLGTARVGSYQPNDFGLYDMYGNVFELCLDWYSATPENFDPATGPSSGASRTRRGGAYVSWASNCRSAWRAARAASDSNMTHGFRICCSCGL